MSKKYANFPIEFANISLRAVDFYITWTEMENKLTALNAEKNRTIAKFSTIGEPLLMYIQEEILKHPRTERDEEKRKDLLKIVVEKLRKALNSPVKTLSVRQDISNSIDSLFWFYAGFNLDQFITDFNSTFENEVEATKEAESNLARLNGQIGAEEKRKKKMLENLHLCFVNEQLPRVFRQWTLSRHTDEVDIAFSQIWCFAKDWKERAAWFSVPVDVHGFRISDRPQKEREAYMEAYTKLGLDKLRKSVVYQEKYLPVVEPVKVAHGDGLPGKFSTQEV